MREQKKPPKCIHLEDGICKLQGKPDKEHCFPWRCRSYEAEASEPEKEQEETKEMWKPEYNNTRQTRTYTSSEVKARYNRKAYDRLTLTLPKGSAELLKLEADERGCSVNRLLTDAITAILPECINYRGGGG